MMEPAVEGLLEAAGSKFSLVTLGARRGRQINSYFHQLGEGLGNVPPQIHSSSYKPLSIAFEEIAAGHITPVWVDPADGEGGASSAASDAEAAALLDDA